MPVRRVRVERRPGPALSGETSTASTNGYPPILTPHSLGRRYIPNSPTNVIEAGLTGVHPSGWFGSFRVRHFGESPLVEDDSARSPAYTTFDLQLGYQQPRRWLLALDIFNLLNVKWNDIEYYYVSRLRGEPAPAADFAIHPGVPRTIRARFQCALQCRDRSS
jgi:outer membrane receptor protein involved in Fe transport